MPISSEQLNQAIKAIETQLAILKQAAGLSGDPATEEGVVGTFDGEYMVQADGRRHQIPPNYASKSMLVPGDTIRMIEDPNSGLAKFKQIGKAERLKSTGILARKDGKFEVLTEEGSFKVLSAAIKHYEGEVGDSVTIQFPKSHTKGSWAAVEKVIKANSQANSAAAVPTPAPLAPSASPIQHAAPAAAPAAVEISAPVAVVEPVVPVPAPTLASEPQPTVEVAAPEPPKPAAVDRPAKPASDRPARPATSTDRKPPMRSDARPSAGRTDRPKPTTDRRATDRPSTPMSRAPRTEAPAPRPRTEPAPQPITPGDTGEISVSAVMDEDDLM